MVGCCFVFSMFVYDVSSLSSLVRAALAVAFRSHGEANEAVAEIGLGAITVVAALDPANRTRLGEAGVCEGLLTRLAVC